MSADRPAPRHLPPDGTAPATIEALGVLSEALETAEAARGHLYQFHRLTGASDARLQEAVGQLREAGHDELAQVLEHELVGRNVLEGRWTFQVVEEYDDGYYQVFQRLERRARDELVAGRRHLKEAAMKEATRSRGSAGHTARPAGSGDE
jgi:hypothetical protein